ncbi:TraR/DksA family transcriptional regulator [Pseudenhygromyxa sp. WMMC2535]|uniref:TraR/DksA family transcriptional regulator n=1 Tax=Pseudenhygromyxa sp. WMMC2535 TaxID=2712867 RepID=UPI001557C199|nr:TraR/DksA family transcriptional regulator [Pseudenhygromyxa sp. WMMC2535]NVB36211.1 TraR/DksA family transcriptional regulator [Pseudenhygromyxa sp. WMMC2535]NVB43410.1 TraR/DksA family transcriptional regulator [Pseudenhygromyxa sp. WMMC2535]
MEHLSKDQVARLRAALEDEAEQLRGRVSTGGQEVAENTNVDPGDVEDAAAHEAGRYRARQLLTRDRARLTEVEAALARMDEGSYGICEETDEPIPFRRLELRPTTRYTAAAQEALEGEGGVEDPHGDEPIAY